MKKRVISCIIAAVMLISAAGCGNSVSVKLNGKDVYNAAQNSASSQQELIENALGPEVWKDHLENDLMKFWTKPDAQDISDGLFNTYLSNSGEKLSENSSELPEEIKAAMESDVMKDLMDIGTNYVRAHSRLTYAYGVAYHMTCNSEYLEMCRKGTLALQEAFDGEPVISYPKAHCWKTSLHSFEHALFGYMTAAQLKGMDFELYYAFPENESVSENSVEPYMFFANAANISKGETLADMPNGNCVYKVTFNQLY